MRWIAYLEATKTEINFEKLKLKVAELKIFPTGRGKVDWEYSAEDKNLEYDQSGRCEHGKRQVG